MHPEIRKTGLVPVRRPDEFALISGDYHKMTLRNKINCRETSGQWQYAHEQINPLV